MFRILAHHLILLTFILLNISLIEVAGGSDLTDLNRDTSKAQEITKDITTGILDSTVTIDNRVFTEEGRNSIAKEHEELKENTIIALKDMSGDGALKFIWNWLQSEGASMHNSYEREASLEGMNRLKDEGVYHIIQNNKYKYYKNGEIE